jgi:hypothetical protein
MPGSSIRRSCHGRLNPGTPKPWPLSIRLKSRPCSNSDSSSATASGPPCGCVLVLVPALADIVHIMPARTGR